MNISVEQQRRDMSIVNWLLAAIGFKLLASRSQWLESLASRSQSLKPMASLTESRNVFSSFRNSCDGKETLWPGHIKYDITVTFCT